MVEIVNTEQLLESSTDDQVINQKVVFLTGDDNNAFFMIELQPNEILPAHYHKEKIEIYYIMKGQGRITTGEFKNEKVLNPYVQNVEEGYTFSISPNMVHQIINTGTKPLLILASAPKSHGGEDRYFVEFDFNGGDLPVEAD